MLNEIPTVMDWKETVDFFRPILIERRVSVYSILTLSKKRERKLKDTGIQLVEFCSWQRQLTVVMFFKVMVCNLFNFQSDSIPN